MPITQSPFRTSLGFARRAVTGTAAVALTGLAAASFAHADGSAASAYTVSQVPPGVRITLGANAVTAPLYEGSARYRVWGIPIVKFAGSGGGSGSGNGLFEAFKRFDVRGLDDVSFGLVKFGGFDAGPLAGYRVGRDEKDSPRLRGFGDIDGGFIAGAYARYDFNPVYIRASLHHSVSGDDTGYLVRLATGTRIPVARGVTLKLDAFTDYADDTYMQSYFGVSPLQSARSGRALYTPDAGFKSAGVSISTEIPLDRVWSLHAYGGYSRLIGDAASSPVVETADRFEARLGLARTFDFNWR